LTSIFPTPESTSSPTTAVGTAADRTPARAKKQIHSEKMLSKEKLRNNVNKELNLRKISICRARVALQIGN